MELSAKDRIETLKKCLNRVKMEEEGIDDIKTILSYKHEKITLAVKDIISTRIIMGLDVNPKDYESNKMDKYVKEMALIDPSWLMPYMELINNTKHNKKMIDFTAVFTKIYGYAIIFIVIYIFGRTLYENITTFP